MKGNAAAIAVGAAVLLVGIALGFFAGRQAGTTAAARHAAEHARPADEPVPEIAEGLVGKWRLQSVNRVSHHELGSKEWYGPIVAEFDADGGMTCGGWRLSGGDVPRVSPAGVLQGTYRFLDKEHVLMNGRLVEKDPLRAALADEPKPVKWVVRIKDLSERLLTLSLYPDHEATYWRTSDEELERIEQTRRQMMREYDERERGAKKADEKKDK